MAMGLTACFGVVTALSPLKRKGLIMRTPCEYAGVLGKTTVLSGCVWGRNCFRGQGDKSTHTAVPEIVNLLSGFLVPSRS